MISPECAPLSCSRRRDGGGTAGSRCSIASNLRRRVYLALSLLTAGLLLTSCAHVAEERSAPRPRPHDEQLCRALVPEHPAFGLELELLGEKESHERFHLRADTYSEHRHEFKRIEGEYYRSRRIPEGRPGPLIIVSPILGGNATDYIACHVFARYACSLGISAFFLYQDRRLLASERDGLGLEATLRESVRDSIKVLRLFLERPEVDPRRLGSLGISLGAIRNILIAACEPRLCANVMVMGGVDLPSILLESREPGVVRYFERRFRREGITREEACEEIRRHLSSEPALFAEMIDRERVLLLLARYDDKVPLKYGQLLKEKLGHPDTYVLPGGHYTSMVLAPYAAAKGFSYMKRRFEAERAKFGE